MPAGTVSARWDGHPGHERHSRGNAVQGERSDDNATVYAGARHVVVHVAACVAQEVSKGCRNAGNKVREPAPGR